VEVGGGRRHDRLPVVDGGGRVVGILTRTDLVRAFARSDREIAREIKDDVLIRTYWIEPGAVTVAVTDGEVVVDGEVDSEAIAESLPLAIERVPGVVSVRAGLTWKHRVT
jgi:CBS domain-containing protein